MGPAPSWHLQHCLSYHRPPGWGSPPCAGAPDVPGPARVSAVASYPLKGWMGKPGDRKGLTRAHLGRAGQQSAWGRPGRADHGLPALLAPPWLPPFLGPMMGLALTPSCPRARKTPAASFSDTVSLNCRKGSVKWVLLAASTAGRKWTRLGGKPKPGLLPPRSPLSQHLPALTPGQGVWVG